MKLAILAATLLGALSGRVALVSAVDTCACKAEELGFKIDCNATGAMLDSLTYLKANSCASDCSGDSCTFHYYVVQSHHDYCPEDVVPEEVEDGFHDYDEKCAACDIRKDHVEGAPDCPAPKCDDDSGNQAYVALADNGCLSDCSSDVCRDNFFVLRVTHDLCDHDTLSRASEEGLHDMEVSCASQDCNVGEGGADQLACADPHAGHDHGDGPVEWEGAFELSDAEHVWSMQKVGGAYADPTMRLVLFAVDAPAADSAEAFESSAATLIEGDSCAVVEDGGTMSPVAASGSCFELHVDDSKDDSTFNIDTAGLKGMAVFAQHGPMEFERDMHYLKDSAGADVEPIGDGHEGHDHGGQGDEDEDKKEDPPASAPSGDDAKKDEADPSAENGAAAAFVAMAAAAFMGAAMVVV